VALPQELDRLVRLESLHVGYNQLEELPFAISRLYSLSSLDVQGNPLASPLALALSRGLPSLRAYLATSDPSVCQSPSQVRPEALRVMKSS
jgi:Leucine-rich repeat (LRR) protein